MGGDHGPEPLVAGALAVANRELEVVLVGDREVIGPFLARERGDGGHVAVVHAPAAISMDTEPALAVRSTPEASVRVMMRLIADMEVTAGVSAGSTGATLTSALLDLGRLPGIRRPAIAGALPVRGPSGHAVLLVDAGASPDIQPRALVDWARLASAYAQARGSPTPSVGLLNVGTEVGKGNELARAGHALLARWAEESAAGAVTAPVTFRGNVEPRDVLDGVVDVVVTDGFTGNILVKAFEVAFADRAGIPPGALILGVRGVVVVAHGAAQAPEVAAAVRTAAATVEHDWLARVEDVLTVAPPS